MTGCSLLGGRRSTGRTRLRCLLALSTPARRLSASSRLLPARVAFFAGRVTRVLYLASWINLYRLICMPAIRSTVASAPGKALITGGYLVTERPNAGAVLTLDARFYAVIRSRPATFATDKISITSVSPQFQNSERTYQYSWNPRPQLEPEYAHL